MERKYIVSDSPGGCLMFAVLWLAGGLAGGLAALGLVSLGVDGRVAAAAFLVVMLVCQAPVFAVVGRRDRNSRR